MENLSKTTNVPKMGTLVFPMGRKCLPGGDTGKRDGHAESGMFVTCGEGVRCEEEEDQMRRTRLFWQVHRVWSKRHIADALMGVCYMSKR